MNKQINNSFQQPQKACFNFEESYQLRAKVIIAISFVNANIKVCRDVKFCRDTSFVGKSRFENEIVNFSEVKQRIQT